MKQYHDYNIDGALVISEYMSAPQEVERLFKIKFALDDHMLCEVQLQDDSGRLGEHPKFELINLLVRSSKAVHEVNQPYRLDGRDLIQCTGAYINDMGNLEFTFYV